MTHQEMEIKLKELEKRVKALEQEPCEDAISRKQAIRIASGYCHYTNIPDELAKLPSVTPKQCEDAISRQAAFSIIECHKDMDGNDAIVWIEKEIGELPPVNTQEPCDKYIKEIDHLRKYIYKLETQIVEQQPCEDTISRKAAIGIIQNWLNFEGYSWGEKNIMKCTIEELKNLPSVSSENTGRWIHWASGDDCSECGWSTGRYIPTTKYCPNCGARMGTEESESCKGCQNICVMYDPGMNGCKDKMEGVKE